MNFEQKARYKYGKGFARQCLESIMKQNKIDTVEELEKKFKTWDEVRQACKYKEHKYANRIGNHGITMNDELYKQIIEILREKEKKAKELQPEVKTVNVNGKEISTVTDTKTGESKVFNNSYSNNSIEEQMKEVQDNHAQFQDLKENNTIGVMNYMEDNIKITPETTNSSDIKEENLNNEEKELERTVKIFEMDIGHPVKVDFEGKIIYDNDDIYTIEKRDGEYQVISQETNEKKNENKGPQLVKKMNNTDKAA